MMKQTLKFEIELDENNLPLNIEMHTSDRVANENIPAYEPDLGNEELKLLEDVIKSNWISEGKYVREFEEKLRISCNRKYALAFK